MRHSIRSLGPALALISVVMWPGCEETVDITDSAYVERLVIHGILESDSVISVSVTRTLPINEPFSAERAMVRDAEVVIREISAGGESSSIALSHTQNGTYLAPSLRKPIQGCRYELTVRWNGRTATASTVVPLPVLIDSVFAVRVYPPYDYENVPYFAVGASFRPLPEQIYVVTTGFFNERTGPPVMESTNGNAPVFRARDTNAAGLITFIDSMHAYSERPERLAVFVLVYDPQYYEFYKTYYTYSGGDGPFSSGSDIVRWNISGDGIGLFIGRRIVWRGVE